MQFFSYFTDLEIQRKLIHAAQVKLEDLGEETPDIKPKDVAREVFEEMFKNMQMLDLSLKHCMEMVEISVGIYDVKDGQVRQSLHQCYNHWILSGQPHSALQQDSLATPRLRQSQGNAEIVSDDSLEFILRTRPGNSLSGRGTLCTSPL